MWELESGDYTAPRSAQRSLPSPCLSQHLGDVFSGLLSPHMLQAGGRAALPGLGNVYKTLALCQQHLAANCEYYGLMLAITPLIGRDLQVRVEAPGVPWM